MNIFFNHTPVLIENDTTLSDFLRTRQLDMKGGIAVAVNNRVVPKEKWEHTVLQENDMLLVIGASYGG